MHADVRTAAELLADDLPDERAAQRAAARGSGRASVGLRGLARRPGQADGPPVRALRRAAGDRRGGLVEPAVRARRPRRLGLRARCVGHEGAARLDARRAREHAARGPAPAQREGAARGRGGDLLAPAASHPADTSRAAAVRPGGLGRRHPTPRGDAPRDARDAGPLRRRADRAGRPDRHALGPVRRRRPQPRADPRRDRREHA